jgi:hypothetical protein
MGQCEGSSNVIEAPVVRERREMCRAVTAADADPARLIRRRRSWMNGRRDGG